MIQDPIIQHHIRFACSFLGSCTLNLMLRSLFVSGNPNNRHNAGLEIMATQIHPSHFFFLVRKRDCEDEVAAVPPCQVDTSYCMRTKVRVQGEVHR
jgi:hypothetical protein